MAREFFNDNVKYVVAASETCWIPFWATGTNEFLDFKPGAAPIKYFKQGNYKTCGKTAHTYLAGGTDVGGTGAPNPLGMYWVLNVLKDANNGPQLEIPEEIVIDEGSNVSVNIKAKDVLTKWDKFADLKFRDDDSFISPELSYEVDQGTIRGNILPSAERIREGSITVYADDGTDETDNLKLMIQVEDNGFPCNDCRKKNLEEFKKPNVKCISICIRWVSRLHIQYYFVGVIYNIQDNCGRNIIYDNSGGLVFPPSKCIVGQF